MSQATARRRRSQAKMGHTHIHKGRRPLYHKKALSSIHSAIEAERRRAAREAASRKKK